MGAAEVTELYRLRLAAANAGLLARINALWRTTFDPQDPMGSIAVISRAASSMITGAQGASSSEAAAYLRALTADAVGEALTAVEPYAVPAGLAGSTAAGMSMDELASIAQTVYSTARQGGAPWPEAASSAYNWHARVAGSEPNRAANATTWSNATDDERLTGRCVRHTGPKACDFCALIADRGYIGVNAGFKAHANCQCVASAEISSHVTSKSGRYRAGRALGAVEPVPAPAPEPPPPPLVPPPRKAPEGWRGVWDPARLQQAQEGLNAALAPLPPEVRNKFEGITRVSDDEFTRRKGANVLAYYRWGSNRISLRGKLGTPAYDRQAHSLVRSGWHPPTGGTGKSAGSMQETVAHEAGHFIEDQLNSRQKADLYGHIEDTLTPATPTDPAGQRTFWRDAVSEYGAGNMHELIAESWAEYALSPNPRPFAKAVGDRIVSYWA